MTISLSAEIEFDKNPTLFHDKSPQQTRNEREFPHPDKVYLHKIHR